MALIHCIVGDEPFLMQRRVAAIEKAALDPSMAEFNRDVFSAKETSLGAILDSCQLLPMFGDKRFVLVKDASQINKSEMDLLLAYFEQPSPSTVLVLLLEKIDKRLKAWQLAQKKNYVEEIVTPYPNQIPQWIIEEAGQKNLTMTRPAAQALSDCLGTVLMAQAQALEKLEIYIHPRRHIEVADVEAVIGDFLSKNVFEMVDQIGNKKISEAIRILDELDVQGEPHVKILFMMIRHFRMLMIVKEAQTRRASDNELAGELGVHPFFVKNYVEQAQKILPKSLRRLYKELLTTDQKLKSSRLSSKFFIDNFIFKNL